jgi:hypothetical protein
MPLDEAKAKALGLGMLKEHLPLLVALGAFALWYLSREKKE